MYGPFHVHHRLHRSGASKRSDPMDAIRAAPCLVLYLWYGPRAFFYIKVNDLLKPEQASQLGQYPTP